MYNKSINNIKNRYWVSRTNKKGFEYAYKQCKMFLYFLDSCIIDKIMITIIHK